MFKVIFFFIRLQGNILFNISLMKSAKPPFFNKVQNVMDLFLSHLHVLPASSWFLRALSQLFCCGYCWAGAELTTFFITVCFSSCLLISFCHNRFCLFYPNTVWTFNPFFVRKVNICVALQLDLKFSSLLSWFDTECWTWNLNIDRMSLVFRVSNWSYYYWQLHSCNFEITDDSTCHAILEYGSWLYP